MIFEQVDEASVRFYVENGFVTFRRLIPARELYGAQSVVLEKIRPWVESQGTNSTSDPSAVSYSSRPHFIYKSDDPALLALLENENVKMLVAAFFAPMSEADPPKIVNWYRATESKSPSPHIDTPPTADTPMPYHVGVISLSLWSRDEVESGHTLVYPGSHLQLERWFFDHPGATLEDLREGHEKHDGCRHLRTPFAVRDGVPVLMNPGDVTIFHALLVHAAVSPTRGGIAWRGTAFFKVRGREGDLPDGEDLFKGHSQHVRAIGRSPRFDTIRAHVHWAPNEVTSEIEAELLSSRKPLHSVVPHDHGMDWTRKVNPADETETSFSVTPIPAISEIVSRARIAQHGWSSHSIAERIEILRSVVDRINTRKNTLADTISADIGKPFHKALFEIEITLEHVSFSCKQATEWLSSEPVEDGYVVHEPHGVVAIVGPWNFPIYTMCAASMPALLCGNSIVLKPSEHAPHTGVALLEVFESVGRLPRDLVTLVLGGPEHGAELVRSAVDYVVFTGSSRTGREVMKACADSVVPLTLELGGLDPAIVLQDADLQLAANRIVRSNCSNSGQVCCAVKRVFVMRGVFDRFLEFAIKEAEALTVGPPTERVDLGPLAGRFQLEKVESFLADAVSRGARVVTGGQRLDRRGFYFTPTILTDVPLEARMMREEPFGPLLPIVAIDSIEEAIALANASVYGLAASVWTKDSDLGESLAARLQVACVGINNHGPGRLGTPWGGRKASGFGRLNSRDGFLDFCTTKLVNLRGW